MSGDIDLLPFCAFMVSFRVNFTCNERFNAYFPAFNAYSKLPYAYLHTHFGVL